MKILKRDSFLNYLDKKIDKVYLGNALLDGENLEVYGKPLNYTEILQEVNATLKDTHLDLILSQKNSQEPDLIQLLEKLNRNFSDIKVKFDLEQTKYDSFFSVREEESTLRDLSFDIFDHFGNSKKEMIDTFFSDLNLNVKSNEMKKSNTERVF